MSGSDLTESEITEDLERAGALISIGHESKNLRKGTELVIYSSAVKKDNSELKAARKLKIKTASYPEALGELTKKYYTIAIAGSHGKSTTTALISLILIKAGLDPTVIVGTKLREFGNSNFRMGKSKYLVTEADEWNRSFHNYFPKVAVITNIDKEHLDTYKDFKGVVAGFERFLKNLPRGGMVVANFKDAAVRKLALKAKEKRGIHVFFYNQKKFRRHPLLIPGRHNQINAEAAWQTAKIFGIERVVANKVFKNYRGAWRRLERLTTNNLQLTTKIYSDYAHHPTEIKATLQALREKYSEERIVCVFEPHQEERLKILFNDFLHAFDLASKLVLLPVYKVPGREKRTVKDRADSFSLAQEIKRRKIQTFYAPDFNSAIKAIKDDLRTKTIVVFMGAGDIDAQARKLLS